MAGDPFGHVKISRKAYETDAFWLEPREFSRWEAWEYMIQAACYADRQWTAGGPIVRLKRGETRPLSLSYLCDAWGWSTKKVRVFLALLIDEERVKQGQKTPQGHTYLLVNYRHYQGEGHSEGTTGAQRGQQSKKVKKKDEADASSNWVSAAADLWSEKAGKPNPGRIGNALKPLVEQYNEAVVLKVLAFYLDSEDPEYLKVERLAETFVKWGTKAKEASGGTTQRNGKRSAPPSWGYDNATEHFDGFNEPDDDSESVQGRGAA